MGQKSKPNKLTLTSTRLAVLMRIHDDPGVHAKAIAGRVIGPTESAINLACKEMHESGFIRRGEPYWADPNGSHPRIPLFLTKKGKAAVKHHLKAVAGIEL